MRAFRLFLLLLLAMGMAAPLRADTVRLENGDQLSGIIRSEDGEAVTLEHLWLGTVKLKRASITEIIREPAKEEAVAAPEPEKPGVEWMRKISLGYDMSRGNTLKEGLVGAASVNRKTSENELTLRADGNYASTDRRMDTQKYGGSARYAFSFGQDMKWFNFYKLDATHDRFSNVDWRLLPSLGVGYWFSDTEDWKAMWEVGAGWERTEFRDGTAERSDVVVIPRFFAQKRIWGDAVISEDFTVWPNLSETGQFRFRSETKLTNPLTEELAMELALIDEFDSDPGADIKENDLRLTSSLVYAF